MNNKDNSKVPIAVLSCFLIAFVLQGILKMSGVLIFEKALDWEIFKIIDTYKFLQIIYYTIIVFITMYCLSFSFSCKCYSKKCYHIIILIISSSGIVALRMLCNLSNRIHTIVDIIAYVIIPFIITITNDKENRVFRKLNIFSIVLMFSINIILYFSYLGLNFWSNLLNSLLLIEPVWLSSSNNLLVQIEVYIGLISAMLSLNALIKYIKRRDDMNLPINIASDEAKEKELEEVKEKDTKKK